jgi:hypothetical protein
VLFWWQVGSFRLLLVPAVALGASLMCSWALGYAISERIDVPSYSPNIGLFLCLVSVGGASAVACLLRRVRHLAEAAVVLALVAAHVHALVLLCIQLAQHVAAAAYACARVQALSIDYSFFLLVRFQEELRKNAPVPEAVVRARRS